jgi:hypothetical protein
MATTFLATPRGWLAALGCLSAILLLAACAAMVPLAPAAFTPNSATQPNSELRMSRSVELPVGPGYRRTLAPGSRWRLVGQMPQGGVYRPVEGVFTIEGRQVHEAYLVVASRAVVGFYLPGEDQYSPLSSPVPLPIGESP